MPVDVNGPLPSKNSNVELHKRRNIFNRNKSKAEVNDSLDTENTIGV